MYLLIYYIRENGVVCILFFEQFFCDGLDSGARISEDIAASNSRKNRNCLTASLTLYSTSRTEINVNVVRLRLKKFGL